MLSDRINMLCESTTIAISILANNLKAEGKDILRFSAGEPDFDTPQIIKDAAITAINEGFTKYTAVDGIIELREAIVNKLKRDNQLIYDSNEVIVSNGAKHSFFNLLQAIISKDDEVIIPAPFWVTYPELVKYSQGTPVIINTTQEMNFKITPKLLKEAITPKTKLLILTSPSNPTGCVYSKAELQAIADVLKNSNILVASDEIYEKLIYDGEFTSVAAINEDMYNRTITINGLSKCVAMTGWRFGYLAAKNKTLIKAIKKLQSQSTANINSITQKAAIVGLSQEVNPSINMMKKEFLKRRDISFEMFKKIKKVSVLKPDGAFYLFINISKIEDNSTRFCENLLKDYAVAVVPGIAFGSEKYFRFSFATDIKSIQLGIKRINEFIEKNYS